MEAGLPGADWITKVVTVGPPVLLVIGLLIILQAAARNKIEIKQTGILSGIVAAFFIMWIVALPKLRARTIEIVTSPSPSELRGTYSLQPVQYRIDGLKEQKDEDLDSREFEFPSDADRVRFRFNLDGLTQSYRNNLETVIRVAQADPECFEKAIRGRDVSRVASKIVELCPGTVAAAAATISGPAPILSELGQ